MSEFDQPVQLRMTFGQPSRPVTLELALSGLVVLVDEEHDRLDEAGQYLTSIGVPVTRTAARGMTFPAVKVPSLVQLPEQVQVRVSSELATLWQLVTHPSEDGVPATMMLDHTGSLRLTWHDGVVPYDEVFHPAAAAVLLHSDLPFVATPEAWERLKEACTLPVVAGRARINLDGYIEIATQRPQLVESSPLPALFRIDQTTYGMPAAYADAVGDVSDIVWDGPRPVPESGPSTLPPLPVALSGHHHRDLRVLVDSLAAHRARAIVWEQGLGRRIMALAALEALDAWPLLIVAPPSRIWVWARHLDMFGRSLSLTHQRADAHLVTYHDLAFRRNISAAPAIVFDELTSPEAFTEQARAGLRRLDGVMGGYRLAIASSWPAELERQVAFMSLLRPGEFRPDVPMPARYPADPARRAAEHVEAYLATRSRNDKDVDTTTFRRSSAVSVELNRAQQVALEEAARGRDRRDPRELLAEVMEIVSAGPGAALSPKVAEAVGRARAFAQTGGSVALVTRQRRTAVLLKASLRGACAHTPVQVDGDAGEVPDDVALAVVRFDRRLPDLRRFDLVVFLDYPWSFEQFDRAVGAASDDVGPQRVVVIHAAGTIDDRLAVAAMLRRELSPGRDTDSPLTDEEVAYLLEPRSGGGDVATELTRRVT